MTQLPPRKKFNWREKAPQLVIIAAVAVVLTIVLVSTLEDTLVEGGSFSGTPLAIFLNALVAFTENVTAAIHSWGYAGLFVLMLLESSSLPIPSEIILPYAGYLVSQDVLNFWLVVLVATVAGLAGSLIDYYIGLKGATVLVKRNTLRGLLFSKERMELAERWFEKYDSPIVFLSRLVPGFRTLISFPAGAVRMPLRKFIAYTTAGCLVWNAILTYVGVYVGANWREVAGVVHYIILAAVVAVLVGLAVFLIWRKKNVRRNESTQHAFTSQ